MDIQLKSNPAMDTLFYDIEILKDIYSKDNYNVVVWGTKEYGIQVFNTLEAFGISVDYFGDNNPAKQSTILCDKKVIGPEQLVVLKNPFVIIASLWFQAIYEQLLSYGIKNIYALLDCLKYPYDELMSDRKKLSQYFDGYEQNVSDRILVEVYGNIGDVIIKAGIFKYLISRFGNKNVYFLVDNRWNDGNASFMQLLSNNVFSIDRFKFAEYADYRLNFLKQLNEKYFKYTISLCNITLHSRRRCINKFNLNVRHTYVKYDTHFNSYVLGHDIQFVQELLSVPNDINLSPKLCVNKQIKSIKFKYNLPCKFVSVNMGASSPLRYYDVDKFTVVADYLIELGYTLVMLGYGDDDENFCKELYSKMSDNSKVISYISKLTVVESFFVILKSEFFIGTESGMWNASFILNKPSCVIYGYGDYGDFKHNDPNIQYITSKNCNCGYCKWYCTNRTENGLAKCIDDITPTEIIFGINRIINLSHKGDII